MILKYLFDQIPVDEVREILFSSAFLFMSRGPKCFFFFNFEDCSRLLQ